MTGPRRVRGSWRFRFVSTCFPKRGVTIMKKLMSVGLAAILGLGLAFGVAKAAPEKSGSVEKATTASAGEELSVLYNVAGPYYSYLRALDRADDLDYLGFYTSVIYRDGYWFVL